MIPECERKAEEFPIPKGRAKRKNTMTKKEKTALNQRLREVWVDMEIGIFECEALTACFYPLAFSSSCIQYADPKNNQFKARGKQQALVSLAHLINDKLFDVQATASCLRKQFFEDEKNK